MNYTKNYMKDTEEKSVILQLSNSPGYLFEFEGDRYYVKVDLKSNRYYPNDLFSAQNLDKILIDYYNSYYNDMYGRRIWFFEDRPDEDVVDFEQDITEPARGIEHFHIRLVYAFIQECLKTLDLDEVKKEFLRLEYEMTAEELAIFKQQVLVANAKVEFLNFKMKQ